MDTIIHNPFARRNAGNRQYADILTNILGRRGRLCETGHVSELDGIARDCLERGTRVVGINGGDGTIHGVLTSFIRVYGSHPLPRILILRGGTMNTVAASLKLKGTPEAILKKWVSAGEGRLRVIKQATLKIGDQYGFIGGAGMITRFLDAYYDGGDTGPVKVVKMLARIIPGAVIRSRYVTDIFQPGMMRVVREGKDMGRDSYTALLVSTVRETGLGFALTYRCYEKPESFHLVLANINPFALVPKIAALWLGRPVNHPGILHHGPCRTLRIEPIGGTLRWMMDGEMYDTDRPLTITTGPTVDILRP
jgi:diacylglycerol kinase family enzyme